MKNLFFNKRILVIWSIVLIIMNLAISQNSKINTFVKVLPAEIEKSAEKVLENGTVIFKKDSKTTQKEILISLDLDSEVTFKKERERKSRFNENIVFEKYQQYYKGIKVDGGGYTIKIDNSDNGRIMLFNPNLYYHLSSLNHSLKEIDEYMHDLNLAGVIQPEISISNQYTVDYRLVLSYYTTEGGKHDRIWIDANSGDVLHTCDYKMELGGTTFTYGFQPMNDVTQSGTTTMRTPNGILRIYEGGPFTEPLPNPIPENEWRQDDIPTTTGSNWNTDASIVSRQTFYTADLCIPQFLNAGINFTNVDISTNNDEGGFAYRGSSTTNARINIGLREDIPVSVFDIMAHELSHCYLMEFLEYTDNNGNMTLHEGLADVFGSYIENFILPGGTDWNTGGDEPVLANIYNRNQTVRVCETNMQNEIRHQRGRCVSHWFFAISTGIPAANIPSIGIQTAMDILIEALDNLENEFAGLPELRTETLLATELNFGLCSEEYRAVLNAWDRVCVPGTEVIFGISSFYEEHPSCNSSNGSLSVNVCGDPPFTFLWSNGQTLQTIEGLSGGTYSVTVTNAQGNTVVGSTNIEEEIIATSSSNIVYWSDIVNQYQLNQSQLINRNIYIEKDLKINLDYSFENVNFRFAEGTELSIEEGKNVNIIGNGIKNASLNACETSWKGVTVNKNALLFISNASIFKAGIGIAAKDNSTINLNNLEIIGTNNFIGIDLNGKVNIANFTNVDVENYYFGLYSANGNSYYELKGGNFGNNTYGIFLHKSPALIENFTIQESRIGIYVSNSPGSVITANYLSFSEYGIWGKNSRGLDISKNVIGDGGGKTGIRLISCSQFSITEQRSPFHISASKFGIQTMQCSGGIHKNDLYIDGDNSSSSGISMTLGSGSQIKDNYIYAFLIASAIETVDGEKNEITNNEITILSPIIPEFAAIRTIGSSAEHIRENVIYGDEGITAIAAQNSQDNIYDCNYIYNTREGLAIRHNSEGQDIKGNHFYSSSIDLLIRSVTGVQEFKGNEYYKGSTRAYLSLDNILLSQFFVNPTIPHHMPSDPVPDAGWFIPGSVVSNYYKCDDQYGQKEIRFYSDTLNLCRYFESIKRLQTTNPKLFFVKLYHLLRYEKTISGYKLPDCIKKDPVILRLCALMDFVDLNSKLLEISGRKENLFVSIKQAQSRYLTATDEREKKETLIQLKSIIIQNWNTLDQMMLRDSTSLDSLKTSLAKVNCTDRIMQGWKYVFGQYIDFIQKGKIELTEQQGLRTESALCSDEYGDAIHLARVLTSTFDQTYFDFYDGCLDNEYIFPRESKSSLKELIVYPNPSIGRITMINDVPMEGEVSIRDLNGSEVSKFSLKNEIEYKFDLNVPSGVYFLYLNTKEGNLIVRKLFITK